ncbi:STAS-like domain-containing protein [Methanosarcina sp. Mfa9]|uniref:STAS-like domain-containing protein n=1 Tax=Methanosarcina sp. Mfa9 TaxID=3439063 RepID=UPI003F87EC1B
MGGTIKIRAIEAAGGNCCVALGDGQNIYARISEAFLENRKVELSFAEAGDLTPAFLNAAVGQLYGSFSEEFIRSNLVFTDIGPDDEIILRRVLERAKCYFENADHYRKAVREVMGGEDE